MSNHENIMVFIETKTVSLQLEPPSPVATPFYLTHYVLSLLSTQYLYHFRATFFSTAAPAVFGVVKMSLSLLCPFSCLFHLSHFYQSR